MTTLYDHRGRPISADLKREHAGPDERWRVPITETIASTLTPERLATLMRDADAGDLHAYLTLAEEMEEREPQYRAALSQRKMASTSSDVIVEAASDDPIDVEIADAVRELVHADAFARLRWHMLDAIGKCYSVVEILWDTDGPGGMWWPRDYRWRDPRWFKLDHRTLSALRISDASPEGKPLPQGKFVVHEPMLKSGLPGRGGLARVVAIAYAAKRFAAPQLVRFLEVMGIPARLARYPAHYTDRDRATLLRELRRLGADAAAVIPSDAQIELLEQRGSRGGPSDIVAALEYWDRQISKAVLGQTMTTDDGSSRAQADVHYSVRVDIVQHDNAACAATINRDLIRPFVELNWGRRPKLPRILIRFEEKEDLVAFANSVIPFIDRGLEVDQREIRERLGLSEPEAGAPLLRPSGGASRPPDDEEEDASQRREPPGLRDDGDGANTARHDQILLDRRPPDVIAELLRDALADGERWRDLTAGSIGRLLHAAEAASSYEELRELLDVLELDTDQLEEVLARVMFMARGAGDARDRL